MPACNKSSDFIDLRKSKASWKNLTLTGIEPVIFCVLVLSDSNRHGARTRTELKLLGSIPVKVRFFFMMLYFFSGRWNRMICCMRAWFSMLYHTMYSDFAQRVGFSSACRHTTGTPPSMSHLTSFAWFMLAWSIFDLSLMASDEGCSLFVFDEVGCPSGVASETFWECRPGWKVSVTFLTSDLNYVTRLN